MLLDLMVNSDEMDALGTVPFQDVADVTRQYYHN